MCAKSVTTLSGCKLFRDDEITVLDTQGSIFIGGMTDKSRTKYIFLYLDGMLQNQVKHVSFRAVLSKQLGTP
jgi:hypothetical protein